MSVSTGSYPVSTSADASEAVNISFNDFIQFYILMRFTRELNEPTTIQYSADYDKYEIKINS